MRLVVVIALVLASACGGEMGAVEVAPEELPFPVRRTISPAPTAESEVPRLVYFAARARLAPVERRVADRGVDSVLRTLIAGPTERERRSGIRSFVPRAVKILRLTTGAGVLRVDFSREFQAPAAPPEVHLRVAQIVWTVTQVEGISSVGFSVEGEPLAVAIDGPDTVSRPVGRADFGAVTPSGFDAEP